MPMRISPSTSPTTPRCGPPSTPRTIDVLVNNAGIEIGGPVELVPLAEVRRLFETNVFGPVRLMQAVLPQMRARRKGTIVNLSSVSGRVAAPLSAFYAASKFALEALSEALHVEAGHFGIRTIVIEPGFFKTNLGESNVDFGVDGAPYDELHMIMQKLSAQPGRDAAPGPEVVAGAIADALESPDGPCAVPVGTDAEMVLGAQRSTLDDASFEKAMREVLNLDLVSRRPPTAPGRGRRQWASPPGPGGCRRPRVARPRSRRRRAAGPRCARRRRGSAPPPCPCPVATPTPPPRRAGAGRRRSAGPVERPAHGDDVAHQVEHGPGLGARPATVMGASAMANHGVTPAEVNPASGPSSRRHGGALGIGPG